MKLVGHSNHSTSFARFAQAARQVMLALALALVAALGTYAIARAAVAFSASMTDAIIGDDGDGKADPGEIIEYTVVINNGGSTDATGVEFDDNPDANTTFVPGSISASPVASNDTYPEIIVGNVSINSASISYSVVSNDYVGQNPTATITAYDTLTLNGGNVVMTTSGAGMGQFTYNPPAGYEGIDTFTYTLTDNPNAASAASNRTATVSINISGMVWFVNNNASTCTANGCGRLSNPFSTLAAFNSLNDGVTSGFINHPAANDNIFIYESATPYTGAVILLSGQKLIGQDATASLSTITGLTPPSSSTTFPAMNSGNGTFANLGSTVTLNSSVTMRGLRINSTTSTGVNDPAGSISGVNVSEVLVNTSTGTAVQLSDVSGSLSFTSISANGAASGISLTNTSGSFTVTGSGSAGSGGTLQNITGSAISLTNTSSTSFSYMNLTGVGDNGVLGSGASGFTMSNSNLTNIGNTLSPDEAALNFTNLGGTSSFTNSTITNAIDDQVIVYQTGATTLTSFTLSGNTFNGHDGDNDAIRYQGYNTTVGTVSIQGNTFQNSDGDFIQVIMENSSNLNLLVGSLSANSFTQPGNTALAGGITLSPGGGAGWNGRLDFDIANNTISSANVQAVNVNLLKPATSGATIDGFIRNNIISNANNNFGGSIQVTNGGLVSQVTVEINGNNITGDNGTAGIYVIGDQGGTVSTGARTDVRVLNNSVSAPRTSNINAVQLNSSTTSANTGTIVCWDMNGNTLAGGGFSGTDSRIRQRFSTTLYLPGYAGTSSDTAAVQTYITGRGNTGVVSAAFQAPGGFYNGSCLQPVAKLLPDSGPSLASNQTDHGSLASVIRAKAPSEGGNSKALFAPVRPAPQQAGGIVNVVVGNLPASKSVTIKFRATVNGPSLPLGTTQLSTQGTVSATNGSSALTDDTAVGGASDPTITLVDRPDTTVVSLNRASGNPTKNATVTWQVVFADAVDSLTASNFSLVQAGGVSGASITSVTETSGPPSTTWNITANTGSGEGTLGLNLVNDTGLTHDVTNSPFTGQVFTIDRTPPAVTINQAGGQIDPTGSSPVNFTAVFTEPVTGFATGDVTLGGSANPTTGTVTEIAPNDGTTYNVAVSGMTNDGTVTASIGAGVAQDMAGNISAASTSGDNSVVYDTVPPSVTIDQAAGQTDPSNNSSINFTAVFSEPVTGFATGDVTVGGSANPTTGTVTEIAPNDGTTYNVAVSGMTSGGTVTAAIGAGVALDAGNNGNTASTSGDNTVTYDATAPDATIDQAAGQADPTNGSPVNFTVVFDEPVTGFATGDVTLGGTANPTTGTVTEIAPNDGTTFNVAVSGMTNDGTVVPTITAGKAQDAAGNGNAASTSGDNTVTYDSTAPGVTIDQAAGQLDPTGVSPIHFTVVFDEPVTGFASGDVTLGGGANPTTGTVTEIAPNDGTTFDVAVSGMTSDGTVIASITANKAQDAAGNGNAASTSTDNSVVYDTVVPSVTIDQAAGQADPSNSGTINFTAVFSEPVTGFATGDVTVGGTANPTTGTVTEIAPNDGTTYNVAVSGMTNDGTVTASIDAAKAKDAGNNDNTASTSGDNTVIYDATAPDVTIDQASGQADPTNSGPVNFTVIFDEPVTGFASGDVTLGGTANPTTGTVTEIAPNDGTTYNVAVNGMTNDGTVVPTITAGKAQDAAGNGNAASTSGDNTVTYDATAPGVTIDQAAGQLDPTGASPIHFTVVFNEPVSGFATGDVTLGGGANPTTGTVTEIAPNDGTTYDVAVSGMTSDGTVTASIGANKAQDAAGNGNDASTSGDNSVVYDTVVPSVTINQASSQVDPTNSSPINFTVVFSEPVTGFATGDVTLGGTASPTTGTVTEIAPNDGTTYNVAVSGMPSDGTIIVSIAAGVAKDAGNNDNTASTSTNDTVTYDATAPDVTIEQASGQADPTKVSPVNFTVVFDEPVTGFATGDVTLGGTANPTTGTVTEIAPTDGTTYNVAVSGMTTGGTVIASIGASVAQDAAGNGNNASTSTDHTVAFTFDTTTTITSDTPDPSIVGEAVTFTYTVTVNGGSGTPTGNVTITNGTNSCTDTVGAGSCTITFTTPGSKTLTATYEGDANFNTSTSTSVSHQVNNANTTTSITSDAPDPSMVGDSLTVNFTVAVVAPGTGTPTGNVTVSDGVDSCIGTVASGSCSITLTTSGLRSLTASYEGDANFGSSTSAAENHTVNEAPAITSPDHITFVVQLPGSFTVLSTGFPLSTLSYTGTLPGGITFINNGDGTATLSGTPDLGTSGTYPLTFTASNGTTDATQNFVLTISLDPIFDDVPNDFWAAPYINAIYYAGITGGCTSSPMNYCPNSPITRAQMAVFLKRAIHGSSYQPPLPASFHFDDIIGHWAQNWIEDLYSEGITAGCGLTPSSYCPDRPVTRAQMAVFLLLLKNGATYTPPPASGAVFTDVPDTQWAAAWIEELAAEGITAGCGGGKYCPNAPVTRAEMAVLIVTALNLVLP